PFPERLLEKRFERPKLDVSAHDQRRVVRRIVLLPEMQKVVMRNRFHGLRRTALRITVGMMGTVERRGRYAKGHGEGIVFFLHQRREPLRPHTLNLRFRKAWVQGNVREQLQRIGKTSRKRVGRDQGTVGRSTRVQRGSEVRSAVRDLRGGARRRSLL